MEIDDYDVDDDAGIRFSTTAAFCFLFVLELGGFFFWLMLDGLRGVVDWVFDPVVVIVVLVWLLKLLFADTD